MGFCRIFLFTGLFIALFSGACYSKKQPAPAINNGFAVVELFTSEGCSSCPAAEAVLAGINDEHLKNVYVLEFHVDYWNNLGWKDMYSNSAYTERQQHYAGVFGLSSTYTPQAVVNGKNELVGSDRSKLHLLINSYLGKQVSEKIGLSVSAHGYNVVVGYSVTDARNEVLNIAIVQKKAETDVRSGENSGRKLNHINVVRVLKTVDAKEQGSLNITLPQGLSARDCIIIAYSQDRSTWGMTGAAEAAIN